MAEAIAPTMRRLRSFTEGRWWIGLTSEGRFVDTLKLTKTESAAIRPLDTSAQMHPRLRLRHNQVPTLIGQDQNVYDRRPNANA